MILKQSRHFQDRMQDRNLDFDHVKNAIKYPDFTTRITGGNKIKVTKRIDSKRALVVVYYKDEFKINKTDTFILITAYYINI